jgi:hypothetical protein
MLMKMNGYGVMMIVVMEIEGGVVDNGGRRKRLRLCFFSSFYFFGFFSFGFFARSLCVF